MRIYYQCHDDLVQGYDTVTQSSFVLLSSDPAIQSSVRDPDFNPPRALLGSLIQLGNGKILVAVRGSDRTSYTQFHVVVDGNLRPDGSIWSHESTQYWPSLNGFVGYEDSGGFYDPVTNLNWLATTDNTGGPWEFNGYDNSGNWAEGRGDTSLIQGTPGVVGPLGDAYLGGNLRYPLNISMLGRWLYRFLPEGDGFGRYNLDTNEWQAILPEPSPGGTTYGWQCELAGCDDVHGKIITVNRSTANTGDPSYQGFNGFIEVRNPNADPWQNPIPNGLHSDPPDIYSMGPPEARYDPSVGGPSSGVPATNSGRGNNTVVVRDGKAYYLWNYPFFGGYGWNSDNTPFGTVASLMSMDLTNGQVTKVCDIPFQAYNQDGSIYTGGSSGNPGPFATNEPDFGALGLIVGAAAPDFGRMMVNVGDDEARNFKFFNPQGGENDGHGVGFINVGDDDNRDWRRVKNLATALQLQIGDDENRQWIVANT